MSYQIIDETRKSSFEKYSVNPVWPLLAVMLIGAWFGYLWFIINSIFLSSYYMKKEIAAIVAAILFSIGFILLLSHSYDQMLFPKIAIKYLLLLVVVIKLAAGYYLYLKQSHSFSLFEYFNDYEVRNGGLILLVGFVLLRNFDLAEHVPFWLYMAIG